jgi:hypothetical protein
MRAPKPQLAPIAEHQPAIETGTQPRRLQRFERAGRSRLAHHDRSPFERGDRLDEHAAEPAIQADIEQQIGTDPRKATPFAAGAEEIAIGIGKAEIEIRRPAEMARKVEPRPEIAARTRSVLCRDDQRVGPVHRIDMIGNAI